MMNKSKKITLIGWLSMILLLSIFIPIAFVENASAPIGSNELLLKGSQKDGFMTAKRNIKVQKLVIPQLPVIMSETIDIHRNDRSVMLEVFAASFFMLLLRRRLLTPIKYTSNYL